MQSLKKSGILTNFLGAITDSLVKEGYSPADTKHLIVAALMEIVEDTTKKEAGGHDFYTVKPVFRYLVGLYQEENRLLQDESYLPQVQQKMQENDTLIQYFTNQLNSIEKNMAATGGTNGS